MQSFIETKKMPSFSVLFLSIIFFCASSTNVDVKNGTSLEHYLCLGGTRSGMSLALFSSVNYSITKTNFCIVQNVSNVRIASKLPQTLANIVCSGKWNGFGFYNTTNLTLYGLVFHHCGGKIQLPYNVQEFTNKSSLYIGPHQRAVLLFSNCFNTMVHTVTINGPYHGFGMLFVNALGQSNITQVDISNNMRNEICPAYSTLGNFSCSGSGIVFVFLETSFKRTKDSIMLFLNNISLNNNKNFYSDESFHSFADMINNGFAPIVSGSGLSLMLCSLNHQTFIFVRYLKTLNNEASHAGGVLIAYMNQSFYYTVLNSIKIENNVITPFNSSNSYSAGITIIFIYGPWKSRLLITSLEIISNKGFKGSGILFHLKPYSNLSLYVEMDSCKFIGNQAYSSGSAILIESTILTLSSTLRYFNMHFSNLYAVNNSGLRQSSPNTYDVSVFAFEPSHSHIVIQSGIFLSNEGSVFQIYSSIIKLERNITCSNNTSNKGSCFNLVGMSLIITGSNLFCTFRNNKALLSGGVIHADNLGIPFGICTIVPSTGNEKMIMKFENNFASFDGNDIKSDNLYNCSVVKHRTVSNLQGSYEFYSKILQFNQSSNTSISSTVDRLSTTVKMHQIIFSGRTINLPLVAIDAAGNPVYTSVIVSVYPSNNHQWRLEGETVYHNIYAKVKSIIKITISTAINIKSEGRMLVRTTSHPFIFLTFNVTILQCPVGFDISNESQKCDCSSFLKDVDKEISCDIQSGTIKLPSYSWFGIIKDKDTIQALSFNCPPEYCQQNSTFKSIGGFSDPLCKKNRTGIMCGQCAEGLSLVFGSDDCHQCSNFWILSLIIYAICGIALVLLLFSIKLTISGGMLGGIIFFANMSQVNLHSDLLSNKIYTRPIKISMAFLNLNLGFPVCFYNGMNNLNKTALLYAFPLYLWCLVLGLVFISRHSTRVANLIVGSSVQVLATLVQFSFSKLLLIVSNTLASSKIMISSNNSFTVWYFEGNIKYSSGKHLILFSASIVVLSLFFLPYLLFISFASYIKCCHWIQYKLRPILDAYNGPYKDRYRFWFGVRQWLMVFLYILYSIMRGANPDLMIAINIIAVSVFLIVQICLKPFKSVIVNLIDTWFLFLLFTANILAFLFVSKHTFASNSSSVCIAVVLSVFLLSVLVIILYHVLISVRGVRKTFNNVFANILVLDLENTNGMVTKQHYRSPLLAAVHEEN